MIRKLSDGLQKASSRLSRYLSAGRWLLTVSFSHARRSLLIVPLLSISSVALQSLSLVLVSNLIKHVQGGESSDFAGRFSAASPHLYVVAVIAALVLSGLTRFGAGNISIRACRTVAGGINSDLTGRVAAIADPVDKWRLLRSVERSELLRVLTSDCTKIGLAVRILLSNTINLFYLLAGLGVFLWVSPRLFGALVGIVAIGGLIAYPMNLKAVGLAKSIEGLRRSRSGRLQREVDTALAAVPPPVDAGHRSDYLAEEAGFLATLFNRFLVVERFRLMLSLLFAMIVGGLLAVLSSGAGSFLFDVTKLLFLFFAFRFTYQGLQGLLLCLTTINRFLPAILRTQAVFNHLDRIGRATGKTRRSGAGEIAGPTDGFRWLVETEGSEPVTGVIAPGTLTIVAERDGTEPELLYRLLSILEGGQARFGRLFIDGDTLGDAPANSTPPDGEGPLGSLIAELASGGSETPKGEGDAERRERIISALKAIHALAAGGAALVVTREAAILSLPDDVIARLLTALERTALIIASPWSDHHRSVLKRGDLLVSTGRAIAFAGHVQDMSAADWERARGVHDASRKPGGGPDIDDLDEIAFDM